MNQKKKKLQLRYGIINLPQNKIVNSEEFLMNIITQETKKRQVVVKLANRKGKILRAESIE